MRFSIGDLVVCRAHQGLGRIVSAKRAFGLCRVRWSEHIVTQHPKEQLLKTNSVVSTKDGTSGRIIALSAAEVKIIDHTYATRWVPLTNIVAQERAAGNGQKVQRRAAKCK